MGVSAEIGHPVLMLRPLSDFSTLTFDCYGTLIDWESGIWEALQPLLIRNDVTDVSRSLALEVFARSETQHETSTPGLAYPAILAHAHRDLAEHLQLDTNSELDRRFGESVPYWPAFTDSPAALKELGTRYRLVVLSNIDRASFAASRRLLGTDFDAVYTAEDIGSYKPDSRNFEYLIHHLAADFGVGPEEILHVAQSLYHDHVPAQGLGLATAWIDRQHLSEGGEWGATTRVAQLPTTDYRFFSLAELAAAAAGD
jgi:2-haloalkanoic acid dehalogenase type II